MSYLPFAPADQPLTACLGIRYIVPAAKWIMRGESDAVLATLGNSSWEAAFSIIFLLNTKSLLKKEYWARSLPESDELIIQIDSKVKATVLWLIEQVETVEQREPRGRNLTSWDGLTWDTSVVLRSLLYVLNHYGSAEADLYQEIEDVFSSSLSWLIEAVDESLKKSYTAGPQDVAEILILVTKLFETSPELYQKIVSNSGWAGREEELSWRIAELLIKTRTEARPFPGRGEESFALWWGEFFGTAEVLEGLSEFYTLHSQAEVGSQRRQLVLKAIEETLSKAILYFDYTQKDGTWGSTITDTARVAMTYVQLTATLPFLKSNSFVAFKSLRWLCAESQIMKDGSFLHSLFLTIYYATTLMTYYKKWALANQEVLFIYDIVLHEAHPMFYPDQISNTQ